MKTVNDPEGGLPITVCPKCDNPNLALVEYAYSSPQRHDGWSEYWCRLTKKSGCGYREGRWTGFELHNGEVEPRYGQITVKRRGLWKTENAAKPVQVGVDV